LSISILRAVAGSALSALVTLGPAHAAAADYPARPVRVIVGFQPGGGSDILSRAIGQKLAERWGTAVVTDNRAGAGGTIALELARNAQPDGHTLLVISGSQITNATLVTKVGFDVRTAYAPITQMTAQPYVLVAHPALPASSVKELVAYARSKPGTLNYGSSGTGSSAHLGMELFKHLAKVDMLHVPYKGSGQAMIDLVAGQVQLLFASAISAMPQVKSGKLKALAVTSAQRSRALPDLPTIAEAGLPGFEVTGWYGLVAPARTPAAIVQKVNRDVGQILATPDVQQKLAGDGSEAAPGTPAQFRQTIAREIEKWTKLVQSSGIKLQ
jgi:tripartite-type tricarboxylate transporter receptor subunit TctC